MFYDLLSALEETLFMVFSAGLLTWIIGLPLGALLAIASRQTTSKLYWIYKLFATLLTTTRQVPYIVLMIALIPLTRFIIGSIEGSVAAIIPLTLAALPTFIQCCEKAIHKVPTGLMEAAKAAGASSWQMVYKVLIPEALPNIIHGLTMTLTHLIGYSTIAGALGGGGFGTLMIYKGYQTFQIEYVLATMFALVALMQIIQTCGYYIANGNNKQGSNA